MSAPIIRTWTGRELWPPSMTVDDVDEKDIAHALSLICRFMGHLDVFWSVAQHSLLVAHLCPQELKLTGLLHDASEAYWMDVPTPIKRTHAFAWYREMEQKIQNTINRRFGVHKSAHLTAVKQLDRAALLLESHFLRREPEPLPRDLLVDPTAKAMLLTPATPTAVEGAFLACLKTL